MHIFTTQSRLGIASVLLAGAVMPMAAEAQAQTEVQPEIGEEDLGGIAAIIVTARKTSESIQTTPVAVSAFSSDDLVNQQITSVTQLQVSTPNLSFSSAVNQPGSATIFIRGQGSSDGLVAVDQAVGAYLNGVYLARSTGGAFDLVDVSRVEVLRGPQGTLFGRNTTGGAINVIPNEPTDQFGGSVRADYGNYDTRLGQVVVNAPIKGDELGLRVAYRHSEHGGYGRSVVNDLPLNDANSDYVRAMLKIEPAGSAFKILLSADYSKFTNSGELSGLKSLAPTASSRDSLVALCNGALTGAAAALNQFQSLCSPAARGPISQFVYNGVGGNPKFFEVFHNTITYGKSESHGFSAIADYDLSDAVQIKSTTAWRGVKLDALADNDGTPFQFTGGFNGSFGNRISQDQFSQELQLSGKTGDLDYILGGFYFVENGTDVSRSGSLFPLSRVIASANGTVRNQSLAGYGQLIYHVTDAIRLTGGLRYTVDKRRLISRNSTIDFFTGVAVSSLPANVLDGDPTDPLRATFNRSFNYASWLASADWQAARGAFFYAKASRSQRSGGFNTRVVAGGNPPISFSPEVITDYEVGAKIDLLDRRIRINLAAFHDSVSNVQRNLVGVAGSTLVSGIANAAKARIRGLEAELIVAPAEGLTFGANYGLTDASYPSFINSIDGADWSQAKYPYTPRHTFSLSGDYEHQVAGIGSLRFHLDYGWRSVQYSSPIQLSTPARIGLTAVQIAAGNAALQNTSKLPSYGLLNGRVAFQLENPNLELAFYARNIAKKKYITRLLALENTPFGLTAYMPGDPRTFGASVSFKF